MDLLRTEPNIPHDQVHLFNHYRYSGFRSIPVFQIAQGSSRDAPRTPPPHTLAFERQPPFFNFFLSLKVTKGYIDGDTSLKHSHSLFPSL